MTIPETTLATIREALRSVDNHTVIRVLPPGHEDIPDKVREKHPSKFMVKFHEAISDSAVRNKLQQKLGGMVVCADGILVAIAANGTPEPKAEPDGLGATELPSSALPTPAKPPVVTDTPDPIEALVDTLAANPQAFREMTGESTKEPTVTHTAAVKELAPSLGGAEPLRPQLKARIERNVSNELYTTLKNNPRVTIELLWGNGDALNIAYVESIQA